MLKINKINNKFNIKFKFFIFIFIFLYHAPVFAEFSDIFHSNPNDMSIQYLSDIFGKVGSALSGQENDMLSGLFHVLNLAVLSLGTITVTYTLIVSALHTAQEGEVMGKNWSAMWLPIRSIGGLALLLPTNTGYSLLQIMMMAIIMKGVDAGNAVYYTVLDTVKETGQSISGSIQTVKNKQLAPQINPILQISSCMVYLNQHRELINNGIVSIYENYNVLYIGVKDHAQYETVCGTVKSSDKPGTKHITKGDWEDTQFESASNALNVAMNFAQALLQEESTEFAIKNAKITIARAIKTPLLSVKINKPTKKIEAIVAEAKKSGWLFAGVNYFNLINPDGAEDYRPTPPKFYANNSTTLNTLSGPDGKVGEYINKKIRPYLDINTEETLNSTDGNMLSQSKASEASEDKMIAAAGLNDAFENVRNSLSTGQSDPISAMKKVGQEIMLGVEFGFWALIALLIALTIPACIWSAILPSCSVMFTIVQTLIPILLFLMTLLWTVGVLLGLYVPMIPYMVFTFSALAWMLMVIEAIVAAPIVALGLLSPSAKGIGEASPAILLITNIVMRPSLMVMGLILAAKLLTVAVTMLNFGFNYFMSTLGTGSYGLFGGIALLIIYGGILIDITEECFSLIHVLPDKINRWIGGHAEKSNVEKQMGEMQKTTQTAGQTSMQAMQGVGKGLGEAKGAAKAAMGKSWE